MSEFMSYLSVASPVGVLRILADESAIKEVLFDDSQSAWPKDAEAGWQRGGDLVDEAARQLQAYFARQLSCFDLPLSPDGTKFQKAVWRALVSIPHGKTESYKCIAEAIGNPKSCRAVGLANGKNPIPVIIPCHRVIGADGSLTGFGGGLGRKQLLLDLENPLFVGA